jgi:hypothetical protein
MLPTNEGIPAVDPSAAAPPANPALALPSEKEPALASNVQHDTAAATSASLFRLNPKVFSVRYVAFIHFLLFYSLLALSDNFSLQTSQRSCQCQ